MFAWCSAKKSFWQGTIYTLPIPTSYKTNGLVDKAGNTEQDIAGSIPAAFFLEFYFFRFYLGLRFESCLLVLHSTYRLLRLNRQSWDYRLSSSSISIAGNVFLFVVLALTCVGATALLV